MRFFVLRFVQRLFIGIGCVALAYAGGTAAYASVYQKYQLWKFDQAIAQPQFVESGPEEEAIVEEARDLLEGDLLGRLEIPRIGISVMVLHGNDEATLVLGAGHVPGTPLPGAEGNVALAAHRDTFFRKLEGIVPGDQIQFATVRQTYEYVVDSTEIVDPENTQVMESRAHPELTLITCYPFYFVGAAPKRFVVHARPLK